MTLESVRHRGWAGTPNLEFFWSCIGSPFEKAKIVESVRHRRWAGLLIWSFFESFFVDPFGVGVFLSFF